MIKAGRRPGRFEIDIENMTEIDVMKILGIGYAISMVSDYFSKRNLGETWRKAFRRNRNYFNTYLEIFAALNDEEILIRMDYDCGIPGCVQNQWAPLQAIRPARTT